MGGISAKKPVLPLITGPMMPGSFRGGRIGACTDCRNNWAAFRANEIDIEDISALNEELAPTVSGLPPLLVYLAKMSSNYHMMDRLGPAASWAQRVPWPA